MLGLHPGTLPQALLSSLLARLHLGIQAPRPWHADPLIRISSRVSCRIDNKNGLRGVCSRVSDALSSIPTALKSTPTATLEDSGNSSSPSDKNLAVPPISPSSVAAFRQCKQLFFFRHILRLEAPSTPEQVRGILVHDVLSRFFDLPEQSRDIENLHELFRAALNEFKSRERKDPRFGYANFFEGEEELRWAVSCLDLLANFLKHEREISASGSGPHETQGKIWQDPERREFKMSHTFEDNLDGYDSGSGGDSMGDQTPTMKVTGIVDRLDRCADGKLRVVDYKTGKVPNLKYNEATNARIMNENFFQLKVYALLVKRILGEVPAEMRIIYLSGPASVTRELKRDELVDVECELQRVWDDIARALAENRFPTSPGRLCDWCAFRDRCPAFVEEACRPDAESDSNADSESDSDSESGPESDSRGGRGRGSYSRGRSSTTRKRR